MTVTLFSVGISEQVDLVKTFVLTQNACLCIFSCKQQAKFSGGCPSTSPESKILLMSTQILLSPK